MFWLLLSPWVLLVTKRVSFWVGCVGGALQLSSRTERTWGVWSSDPDFICTVLLSLEITAVISILIGPNSGMVPTQWAKAVEIQNNECSEICSFLSHVKLILVHHEDADHNSLLTFFHFHSLSVVFKSYVTCCSATKRTWDSKVRGIQVWISALPCIGYVISGKLLNCLGVPIFSFVKMG